MGVVLSTVRLIIRLSQNPADGKFAGGLFFSVRITAKIGFFTPEVAMASLSVKPEQVAENRLRRLTAEAVTIYQHDRGRRRTRSWFCLSGGKDSYTMPGHAAAHLQKDRADSHFAAVAANLDQNSQASLREVTCRPNLEAPMRRGATTSSGARIPTRSLMDKVPEGKKPPCSLCFRACAAGNLIYLYADEIGREPSWPLGHHRDEHRRDLLPSNLFPLAAASKGDGAAQSCRSGTMGVTVFI